MRKIVKRTPRAPYLAHHSKSTIEDYRAEVHLTVVNFGEGRALRAGYKFTPPDAKRVTYVSLRADLPDALAAAVAVLLRRRGLSEVGTQAGFDLYAPDATTMAGRRWMSLMPNLEPKWVRVYDNGRASCDRYTAVFSGAASAVDDTPTSRQRPYLSMSAKPYHPQGFGQHGFSTDRPCDVNKSGWAPPIGGKNHLGTRINFRDLPEDCQRFVIGDYIAMWKL